VRFPSIAKVRAWSCLASASPISGDDQFLGAERLSIAACAA
jgi:hypothetical protein